MHANSAIIAVFLAAAAFCTLSAETASGPSPVAAASPSGSGQAFGGAGAAAETGALRFSDPSSLLGATLPQVIETFGSPRTVHSVRGPEAWQDDVVFVYDGLDFYWFRDRVWQVRAGSAFGLNSGDSRETALSLLGEPLHRMEDAFVYQLPSRAWPLRLRVGFDAEGRVTKLFVYRADF
jgi:hypothetical protein